MALGLGLRAKFAQLRREITYAAKNSLLRPRLFNLQTPERIGSIYREPSDMCLTDRIMLYALVRGLRPQRALEIGARWGGSATIITNSMQENGTGKLVGIDPAPEAFRAPQSALHGRYVLVTGYSPDAIPEAMKHLDDKLDFAFIDGLHTYDAVSKDLGGIIPFLEDGAHVLLHDTYHQGIDAAVREACSTNTDLFDCGFLTREPTMWSPVSYQGLRLVRKGIVNSQRQIAEAYTRSKMPVPAWTSDHWNRDIYLDKI